MVKELLERMCPVHEALSELKKPGGGYIPPLSKGRRKQLIKELRTLKKYIVLKTK